jgi:hypothetical protein
MILYIGDHLGSLHAFNCVKEDFFLVVPLFKSKIDSIDQNIT